MIESTNHGMNKLKRLIKEFKKTHKNLPLEESIKIIKNIVFFQPQKAKFSASLASDNKSISGKTIIEEDISYTSMPMTLGTFTLDKKFYRVRKLKEIPKTLKFLDFWEPPINNAFKGRLNAPQKPYLYISDNIDAAQKETHVSLGDMYLLMIYQNIKNLELTEIGFKGDYKDFNKGCRIRHEFLADLFCTPNEYIYDISATLANKFVNLKKDGWCYPSIASQDGKSKNICLNTSSKEKLELIGVFIFRREDQSSKVLYSINVKNINDIQIEDENLAETNWQLLQKRIKDTPHRLVPIDQPPKNPVLIIS